MIHPSCIDHLQKDNALHFSDLLCLRELGFLRLIRLHSSFLEKVLQFLLALILAFFQSREFKLRDHIVESYLQPLQIPFLCRRIRRCKTVYCIFHIFCDHAVDRITHALSIEDTAPLSVDDLSLLVHDLVILEQVLADTEVVVLNLLLCLFDGAGEHLMLDLLAVLHTERIEHAHKLLGAEQSQQVVLQ